jgi:limonene-1,2-epoxide hydrolase
MQTTGLAALAHLSAIGTSEAIVIGDGNEKKNVEVVNAMLASWSTGDPDKVAAFFAEECSFRGGAQFLEKDRPASKGRDGVRASVINFLKRATVTMTVHDTFARGDLVVNSHYQFFEMKEPPQGQREDWFFGVYWLKDGLIQEWNDYPLIPFNQPAEKHSDTFGKFIRI